MQLLRACNTKILLAIVGSLVPFVGSLFYFVLLTNEQAIQVTYALVKCFTLFLPLIAYRFFLDWRVKRDHWNRQMLMRSTVEGLAGGLAFLIVLIVAVHTPLIEVVWGAAPAIFSKVDSIGLIEHFAIYALFLSTFHAFLEEYYWRWFLFRLFDELLGGWSAHILAGLAFALHHFVVLAQFFPVPVAFGFAMVVWVGGIIWSLLYLRHRTLLGAGISHMLVDFGLLTVGREIIQHSL